LNQKSRRQLQFARSLAIPSIAYVEALSTWEKEKEYAQQFQDELDKRINDTRRDRTSLYANSLLHHLEQSRILNERRLNDLQDRLSQAIEQLLTKAETITLNNAIIRTISDLAIATPETLPIKNDLMDNIILKCILVHSSLHPVQAKAFLSGNNKDFGKPDVQKALRDTGVDKYFISTGDFLGWLQSQ
jgi:PIN domain